VKQDADICLQCRNSLCIACFCTTDAWLMTNGFDAGIVQVVGQALNKIRLTKPEENITAIAVAKFGCITNYQSLKDPSSQVEMLFNLDVIFEIIRR
jgi:hypothetical protein